MKSIGILSIAAIFLTSFYSQDTGTVKGRVVPYNAALNVWAVSDKDTIKTTIQSAGEFELKPKPGLYRIIIEGRKPYKTTTKTGVLVNSGTYTDIGDVILDQ